LFAEIKGPYALGSFAVTRKTAMLAQTYAMLIVRALRATLRAATIGEAAMHDPQLAMLAAPLLRWAQGLAHPIQDMAGRKFG
jgi:hypothetical protein